MRPLNYLMFIVLISLIPKPVMAQGYHIEYTLHGVKDTMAWLCEVKGKEVYAIDSCMIEGAKTLFAGVEPIPHGVYKIVFNDTLFTDIIYAGELVRLESRLPDIIRNMKVYESTENQLLFGYWNFFFAIRDTLDEVIRQGRELYYASQGKPSKALDRLQEHADRLEQQKLDYVINLKAKYPDQFAPKLVWAFQPPDYRQYLVNDGKPYASEKEFYENHFFDRLDFSDPRMIYTEVLFVTVNDYLKTFGQPATSENYISLIGNVLKRAKAHPEVYQYCIELFLSNFEISIWEPVFLYLIEDHYLKSPISNPHLREVYRKRAQAIRSTSIGTRIPEICGTSPDGKRHCLHKSLGTRTVVFFWSLGCDHCEAMIPGLISLSKEYAEKGLKVFAFTLADDRDSLARTLKHYGIDWINISDYQGLVSPVIDQFNISITPVLYLLDGEGVITDKPKTLPVLYSNLVVRYRND